MNAPEYKNHAFLPDVQDSIDQRATAIQQVGVRGVRYPVWIRSETGALQPSVATWNLYVYLPETKKGTHMSRFIELLEQRQGAEAALDVAGFRAMLRAMTERLETHAGRIEVSYPFFIAKAAPISGVSSLLDYEVRLLGEIEDGVTRVTLTVQVPVTSLCPCSKEISQYGAHNQRSHVTMQVELLGDLSAEELVRMAEEEASCELYGLLKRPDEKYVTERAYENPKFVEDMVRDVVHHLEGEPRIGKFVVEVENFESIHNHSAYARVERT